MRNGSARHQGARSIRGARLIFDLVAIESESVISCLFSALPPATLSALASFHDADEVTRETELKRLHLLNRTVDARSALFGGSAAASVSSKFRMYMHTSPASFLIGAITWLHSNLVPGSQSHVISHRYLMSNLAEYRTSFMRDGRGG